MTFLLILISLFIVDLYAYRGIRRLFTHRKLAPFRSIVLKTYWLADILLIVFALGWAYYIRNSGLEEYVRYRKFFLIMAGLLLIFLPKLSIFIFTFFYDLKLLLLKISHWLFANRPRISKQIVRWRKSLIVPAAGVLVAVYMFSVTIYGMGIGRYNFKVQEVELWFEELPAAFDGFKIVQFSDTHLGSFINESDVEEGLKLINSLRPDIIVFTGDMVNNAAEEALRFVPAFKQLQADHGLFSILGNHDMGDYRRWGTIAEKSTNLERLIAVQGEMGFDLLQNEHRFIRLADDSIMIAGVENWGIPPFDQYGDLAGALGANSDFPFIILLSHDPSHWRAQVIPQTNVNLTLSGHTHGMQFGVTNRFFSWSPVQLKYNEWNGLYQQENQKLYVNRGFGFLSFPGRIGMPPEITLIVLRKSPAYAYYPLSKAYYLCPLP